MPREELVIATFDKGIISGADQADIAEGAAAWSIDEHPNSIPGTVQPRLTDTIHVDDASMTSMQYSAWITRADGKRDLIYYSPTGGSTDAISDFFSAKTISTLSSEQGTSETVSFTVFNRGVRMGWGNNAAKYIGYVDHAQFGGSVSTSLQYIDSELKKLTTFPHPYKVIGDTDYQYGIEYQGKKIYKFVNATGVITTSTVDFVSLQGICNFTLAVGGAYMYVYDQTDPSYGTLYKIAKSDLSINATYPISGWGAAAATILPSTGLCTDIETSTAKIWFAIWHGTDGFPSATTPANGRGFLFNFAIASLSDGTSFQPVNVSFETTVTTPTVTQGKLYTVDSSYAFNNSKTPLIKTSEVYAAEIAFLCNITGAFNSSIPIDPNNSIVVMNDSSTVNATMASANCRLVKFSTVGYNNGVMIKGSSSRGVVFGGLTTAVNAFGWNGAGGNGNTLQISDLAWGNYGIVETVSVAVAGNGYNVNDLLTLTSGSGTCECEVATLTGGAGTGVATVTRLAQGTLYNAGTISTTTVAPAGGTGCTINILTVTDNGYQTEVVISTSAKSVIGSMTDCTDSIVSVTTNTATVAFMSSVVTEYGRYHTNTVLFTNGTWGAGTAVKRTEVSFELDAVATPVGILTSTKKYYYRSVLRYQDYQGSPLYQDTLPESITPSSGDTSVLVDIFIDSTAINTRVTGVDIFRAESSTTDSTPTTYYRLVHTADIRSGWALETSGAWTTRRRYSFYDTGNFGVTYETEYGIPEILPNNKMNYTVSCAGAGYLFVTQGYNTKLEEVANIVFRSKRNAPDTFDWSNDFCVLPSMVNALHYFKGYLYAFADSIIYVVDPENLVLVGEYPGMGASNPLAITDNESAMFFANGNNVYMHDGKTPVVISEGINQIGTLISGATSHRTLAASYTISMCMMGRFNCLVVGYMGTAAEDGQVFVYNLDKKAWYYWTLGTVGGGGGDITWGAVRRSIFSDYLGNLYFSVSKGIAKICGSGNGKVATWYSKLMELGDNTTLKKIYKVTFNGTCDLSIGYNSPTNPSIAVTSGSYLAALATKQTSVQLKAAFTSGQILRGITLIIRKTIGLR